jgi:serine/threonine protein phosphatase 1
MRKLLDRVIRRAPAAEALAPRQIALSEMPPVTYAVGDIHGRLDLYRKLEARIAAEAATAGHPVLVVLLGDLVDRGPDSAGLLDHLTARPPAGLQRQALMGNHEEMMLRFLGAPKAHKAWLSFGGRETLQSYGLLPDPERGFDLSEARLRHMLAAHVPEEHIAFLRGLPAALRLGQSYFLCHAGIDPAKPLAAQSARDLMWTREMEAAADPPEGVTVVHGHVPVERACPVGWRLPVDTGAYATGRLSAVRLTPDRPPKTFEVTA